MLEPENTQGITIKVKLILADPSDEVKFLHTMEQYRQACNLVSQYVFDHDFPMNQLKLQKLIYQEIRQKCGLKSMMAQSAIRGTIARYKTIKEQMFQNPYEFQDKNTGRHYTIPRTLQWLRKPINFSHPQVDLVRNRDWSKLADGTLSINTLDGRVVAKPVCSENFQKYFDGSWKLGGAKLLRNNGCWMLHISATKQFETLENTDIKHVVGIDRGLRFLATTFDEHDNSEFFSGKSVMQKRQQFTRTRERLQRKHTWSSKRALKRLSNRENRWMADVNHRLTKTLVKKYGAGTLFVLEDLTGVSFDENNLKTRGTHGRQQLRSWAFYQFEQFLSYKARLTGSSVIKVSASYTSQRCPKCGGIHKEFRNHATHEFFCQNCGYRANDDLTGARNIYLLGTMYVSGVEKPKFEKFGNVGDGKGAKVDCGETR